MLQGILIGILVLIILVLAGKLIVRLGCSILGCAFFAILGFIALSALGLILVLLGDACG